METYRNNVIFFRYRIVRRTQCGYRLRRERKKEQIKNSRLSDMYGLRASFLPLPVTGGRSVVLERFDNTADVFFRFLVNGVTTNGLPYSLTRDIFEGPQTYYIPRAECATAFRGARDSFSRTLSERKGYIFTENSRQRANVTRKHFQRMFSPK